MELQRATGADDILGIQDYRFADVDVPEWNRIVTIRNMNGGDLVEFVDSLDGPTKKTAGVRMIQKSAVISRENPVLMFEPTHIEALKKKDAKALGRLVDAIRLLNGLKEQPKPHTCTSCGHIDGAEGETPGEGSGEAR